MPGFRLTEDEAWDAIARAHTGLHTTLRRDGRPIALPVWHVVIERAIYIRTPSRAQKLGRIRHDPRGHFLVETGRDWAELAAVSTAVTATIITESDQDARVGAAMDRKYTAAAAPTDRLPPAVLATYADLTTVRLDPTGRLASWNNRALLGDETTAIRWN